MSAATMAPETVAMVSCGRAGCPRSVPPQRRRRGEARRFCSPHCRTVAWEAEHPRLSKARPEQLQKALDFATPAPRPNATAPKERKVALQRKCLMILNRLEQGPALASELVQIGGFRFSARIDECRHFLRALAGKNPFDKTQNPILCSRAFSANPVYMLALWAAPASREATRRAAKA